jgi:hypothetical protein
MLLFIATYSAIVAAFVGLACLAFALSLRSLMLPFMILLGCGLLLSVFVYWVRQSYSRPKTCAIRFALVVFFYLQIFALAIGFGAVKVGILSLPAALEYYTPLLLPGAAISSVVVYVSTRTALKDGHP